MVFGMRDEGTLQRGQPLAAQGLHKQGGERSDKSILIAAQTCLPEMPPLLVHHPKMFHDALVFKQCMHASALVQRVHALS